MALDVLEKTEINKARKGVTEYAFDPKNDPVWIGGITEANILTGYPVAKGTKVQRLAKFLGKVIDYTLEVTEFKPENLMVMKSIKSPFPMIVTYSFVELNDNMTLAQIRIEGSSKSFYGIADFLMKPMVRRNLKGDLKRLKQIMEK